MITQNSNGCMSCVSYAKLVPEKYTTEVKSAVLFGGCEEVCSDSEKIQALRLICEKYAPSNMQGFDEAIKRSLHRTAIYKIKINQISGKAKLYN